jgi:LPS-assembly protein
MRGPSLPLPTLPRHSRFRRLSCRASRLLASSLAAFGAIALAQPVAPLSPIVDARPFGPLRPPLSLEFGAPPAVPVRPPAPPPPRRDDDRRPLPIVVEAQEVRGRPDLETVATGDAQIRRGQTLIRADRLSYDQAAGVARATGNVRIEDDGSVFSGPELQLHLQTFEGFFTDPSYFFGQTGGGGNARRVDFIDRDRATLTGATYSSCRADGSGGPAWLLSAERVDLDLEANEGRAESAVLRFYGVPILAAPVLSFPLTDQRKSGWLPPDVSIDSKSGLETQIPYYWNIAPQRDATFTPEVSTRRGMGLGSEFRYLEPEHSGIMKFHVLPNDRVANRSRQALDLNHAGAMQAFDYRARVQRVSDDDYWKDFSGNVDSFTPRLLPTDVWAGRRVSLGGGDSSFYARVQRWQLLQSDEADERIDLPPYQRSPQIGLRYGALGPGGTEWALETEFNRFTLPSGEFDEDLNTGDRLHALGSVSRNFGTPGWRLTPRLSFNAASYALDEPLANGQRHTSRFIPTVSLDNAWLLERDSSWFGRRTRQTLEPRLQYVYTPYRRQIAPAFDSAGRDFNFESIFSENDFSGVDRVNDAHQLTAGVTTRLLHPESGAEALRLGVVQRYLFGDQRITPDDREERRRFSDVLLLGSSNLVPAWTFDASVLYNPDARRTTRSILGARYSPGPFRTISTNYRYTRGLSEQVELAWQWPIYRREAPGARLAAGAAAGGTTTSSCPGTFYGVGRVNYSSRDARLTDALVGVEYDAGCWIGRFVAERLSTGRSEATTRLMLQLELVGLSRLGTNPLRVLRDNIPGYRLLREDRVAPTHD